jgi:predicted HicB family RNase H-like nuclease
MSVIPHTLSYRGYTATLEWLPEEKIMIGRLDDIPDTITFKVTTLRQLYPVFKETVDAFLEGYKSLGRTPPTPVNQQ